MKFPEWVRPAGWGAASGAVAIAIVGFSAGWVITTGTAAEMAEDQANQAVITAMTPICVARFNELAEMARETHIAALEEESSWSQGDYIEEQGWATMPGAEEPNDEIAEACSEKLLEAAGA